MERPSPAELTLMARVMVLVRMSEKIRYSK